MASDGKLEYDVLANTRGFTGPLGSAGGAVSKLGGGIKSLIGPVGALVGVAGGLAGIGKALKGAADMESTQVAFRTLVGDAGRAETALKAIQTLGAKTPFEFPELADAGRKLIAFGQSAEQVPGTLAMIGDIASGVQAPIGDIAEIFGKAQVAGTLYAEDINQLVGRGIPVIQEFAKQLGVSEGEVKAMAAEGKISFPMLQQAFGDLTAEGGKFYGMMDAQSGTTNGLLSTLKDNVNQVFLALGTPINDAIKPVLEGAIATVGRIGEGLQSAVAIGKAAFEQGRFGELLGTMLEIGAAEGINHLAGGLSYVADLAGRLLQVAFRGVTRLFSGDFNDIMTGLAGGLGGILVGVGDIIRGSIGGPFNEIVAYFQAGLQFGIEKVMEGLGKIPGIGEYLGLDNFSAASFEDILSDAMGAIDPAELKAQGEAKISAGLDVLADALKSGGEILATDFADAYEGLAPYTAGNVKDPTEAKQRLADLVSEIGASTEPIKKAAEDAGKAVAAPIAKAGAPIAAAVSAATGGQGSELSGGDAPAAGGRSKIRLFNAADSEARRIGRMSDVDKAKLAAGGSRLGVANASPGLLAGAASAAARGGSAMTPPSRRGAAAAKPKTAENKLVELLTEIAGNTVALKNFASA